MDDSGTMERDLYQARPEVNMTTPPLTLHAETLISNLEHGLAFARMFVQKAETDLAVLKSILGR